MVPAKPCIGHGGFGKHRTFERIYLKGKMIRMIRTKISVLPLCIGSLFYIVFNAEPAFATQTHGAPEGIYAHQMAHLFFMFSMGTLIYWLRARRLVEETGWRYIQYAAFFLILWNIDAFVVHLLDEMPGILRVERINFWQIRIQASSNLKSLEILYYIAKLDHLLCVPALLFLYAGLKRLLKDSRTTVINTGVS